MAYVLMYHIVLVCSSPGRGKREARSNFHEKVGVAPVIVALFPPPMFSVVFADLTVFSPVKRAYP